MQVRISQLAVVASSFPGKGEFANMGTINQRLCRLHRRMELRVRQICTKQPSIRFKGSACYTAVKGTASVSEARRVLVVPGYLIDSKEMIPLVELLRKRGYYAVLPPLRWHYWTSTIGGRSFRPILDLLDYSLSELANGVETGEDEGYEVPLPEKPSLVDRLTEFVNPSEGRIPSLPTSEQKMYERKCAVVASSAAGWAMRILLGDGPEYSGRSYNAYDRVDSLVTLGSPHSTGSGVTKKNMEFVNTHFPGAHLSGVRYACVAGKTKKGVRSLFPDFTYQSYTLCLDRGDVWGDGVIPVESALSLDGAEKLLLDDVWHLPGDAKNGQAWYGSESVVDKWIQFLEEPVKADCEP